MPRKEALLNNFPTTKASEAHQENTFCIETKLVTIGDKENDLFYFEFLMALQKPCQKYSLLASSTL